MRIQNHSSLSASFGLHLSTTAHTLFFFAEFDTRVAFAARLPNTSWYATPNLLASERKPGRLVALSTSWQATQDDQAGHTSEVHAETRKSACIFGWTILRLSQVSFLRWVHYLPGILPLSTT